MAASPIAKSIRGEDLSKSVKQHWVPQFYLKEFSTPETRDAKMKKVWAFHREKGDPLLVNVEDIAAQRHLYTPACPEGKRDWKTDDKLTDLEELISKVWPTIAHDYVNLSDKHIRMAVSLFVATLILRHPCKIAEVKKIHDMMVSVWEKAPKDSEGRPYGSYIYEGKEYELDSSEWHNYKNATDYDHQIFFTSLIESETGVIAELLIKKRWSVVISEAPVFITTDNPVIAENQERERFGLGTKGTLITFPLSPTRILCMDDKFEEPASQYYPLKVKNGAPFNQVQWAKAYRFMISPRHPVNVLTEIIEYSETLEK